MLAGFSCFLIFLVVLYFELFLGHFEEPLVLVGGKDDGSTVLDDPLQHVVYDSGGLRPGW